MNVVADYYGETLMLGDRDLPTETSLSSTFGSFQVSSLGLIWRF